MSDFRDPSLTPAALATIYVGGPITLGIATLCTYDFNKLNTDEYHQWVRVWKQAYSDLTGRSRELRRTQNASNMAETQTARHQLRILSNTLLNARSYARSVRRAKLDAEYEASKAV